MIMPKELKAGIQAAKDFEASHPEVFDTKNGVHFAQVGEDRKPDGTAKPLLLLLHGSPGDWGAWAGFLKDPVVTNRFLVLAPDRPGYGRSSPGVPFERLTDHAKEFVDLIANHPGPKIWAGHSFGAPIIARAAIDYPEAVDAAILMSGGLDPEYEQIKWYHKLGNTWVGRKVMPGPLRMANDEVYLFFDELTAMEDEWDQIRCPTWVVHGTKDGLADFAEAEFAMRKLTNAPAKLVALEGGNHLIIWNQVDVIRDVFLEAADAVER